LVACGGQIAGRRDEVVALAGEGGELAIGAVQC
jgi:hypothetical protein